MGLSVKLIAHTALHLPIWETPYQHDSGRAPADALAEFAGRSCYQSWHNPSGRSNQEYLENILNQGHFSVLEHASATFYIEGVSRALTHELIRHRHLSYSQLSQRFVDERQAEFVTPPALSPVLDEDMKEGSPEWEYSYTARDALDYMYSQSLHAYRELVDFLQEKKGLTRKQAREAARAALPNAIETKIVVTGNHRAWREFLAKRLSPSADAEIQQLAKEVLRQLKGLAPHTYQDFPGEPDV